MLAARSEDKLQELAQELGGEERAVAVRCDVTSWDDQQALVRTALDRYGRMDAYFANAGFGAKRGFLEETPEFWRSMVDTNVLGAAYSIRASLAHFREQDSGHMLLTSSVAGRRALAGIALLGDEARRHRHGRGAPPGGRRHRASRSP